MGGGDGEIIAEKDWKGGEDGGGITVAMALVVMSTGMTSAKKKEKVYLPDCVLKAQTVLVVILPGWGEPMNEHLRTARHKRKWKRRS